MPGTGTDTAGAHGDTATGSPLRILIVSDYYAPFIGGAERQTHLLAHQLAVRGHLVEVATIWSPGFPATDHEPDGVIVHRLRQIRTCITPLARQTKYHATPFPEPLMVAGLRRILREFEPDIIQTYGWISYSCAAALIGNSTPLVISSRDYAYGCPIRTLVYHGAPCSGPQLGKCAGCAGEYFGHPRGWITVIGTKASGWLLRRKAAGLHSVSRYVDGMVQRDFIDARAAGIPHAIVPSFAEAPPDSDDLEDDPSLAPHLDQLPAEPYILFVGALRREKGIGILLEAYERLDNPPPLIMIGPVAPDTPRSLPAGARMLHDFPHRAVMAAWRHALFGVTPSLLPEPLGSVVYEGMSVGKAMIGTAPGGHADMITDGVSGRLVPTGDVDALTAAMREMLDDPATRERYGEAARAHAAPFVAPVTIPKFEALYREVIARAHSVARAR